jgi:hypothetical protein
MNSRSGRPAELPQEPAMRSLRVKFTILSLMLAVAVVALLLTLAVRMPPQPVRVWMLGDLEVGSLESAAASGPSRIPQPAPGYEILWSDGSKTKLGYDAPIPWCNGGEPFAFGFLRRVEWYVGQPPTLTSYTWHTSWPSEQIQDLYTTCSPYFWGFLRFATHANVIFIILTVLLWALVFKERDLRPSSTLTNRVWPPSPAVDSEKQGAFADRTA